MPDTRRIPRRVLLGACLFGVVSVAIGGIVLIGDHRGTIQSDFSFTRSTTFANGEEERLKAFFLSSLEYPRHRVFIYGHSGTVGNSQANQTLSEQRANAAKALYFSLGLPIDRLAASEGVGGSKAFDSLDDQSSRAYQASLARVTVALVYDQ